MTTPIRAIDERVLSAAPGAVWLWVILGALVLMGGCKPKPGDTCKESRCSDPKTALWCNGTYTAVRCGGPKGCSIDGEDIVCDQSTGVVGEACFENVNACSDRTMLACVDGKFAAFRECRGPRGCTPSPKNPEQILCDVTQGKVGDPCGPPTTSVCAVSGKELLTCVGGKLALDAACPGVSGCTWSQNHAVCDGR